MDIYQSVPIPVLGGVNRFTHPLALPVNQVISTKNLAPVNHQVISKRPGLVYIGGIHSMTGGDYPLAGVISPHVNFGDVIFVSRPSSGLENLNVKSMVEGSTTAIVSASMPFFCPRPWMFVFDSALFILAGPDAIPSATGGINPVVTGFRVAPFGATYTTNVYGLSGTNNELLRPRVASAYKQRVVYANFGPGYENTIVFTDDGSVTLIGDDVLAVNGRGINLTVVNDGDEIVALVEVMLFNVGSPASSALLILRRYGNPFLLTGELDQTTGGDTTLDIKRISVNSGCASPYTIARTPYGIIWAGQDDVWCFEYGTVRNVGLGISPVLKISPPDQQNFWSGAYFNGFYRLAIWAEGQNFSFPNAPSDQWWLNLSNGLPKSWQEAEWFGPQQIVNGATNSVDASAATRILLTENRARRIQKLYGIETGVVLDASVRGIVLVEYDKQSGRDLASNSAVLAEYLTNNCEIASEVITKEYDVAPTYEKGADGIKLTIRPDNDIAVEMAILVDGGQSIVSTFKTLTPGTFRANVDVLDTDRIGTSKPQAVSLYAPPGERPVGQTFQYIFHDLAGYAIIAGQNDTLVVLYNDSEASGLVYQWAITIPGNDDAGMYTLEGLASAVVKAINDAKLLGEDWGVSVVSGIPTFTVHSDTDIQVGFVFASSIPDSGLTPTAAQIASSKRLGAMLGFDVSTSRVSTTDHDVSLTGVYPQFKKGIAGYDLWGVTANIEVFPRDP